MKKRRILTGVVTLMSVVTLAACSQNSSDTKIVTMKGDTITVGDFYDKVKSSSASKQALLSMIIQQVFEKAYGDKVTDKEVADAYNKAAEYYGDSFETVLSQQGYTKDDYKAQIRSQKLVEYAVKKEAEKNITTTDYKNAYKSYTPEITAQVIQLDSEDTAKSVLSEVKADGADFAKIAKEKTKGSKTEYTFDSGSTDLPTDVRTAALALDKNGISDVISTTDSTGTQTAYYIVKVTKKSDKNADWKAYKSRLKEIIVASRTSDSNFQNKVIGNELKKANVKIKDKTFSDILATFTAAADSSSTTTTTTAAAADTTTANQTTAAETTSAE